MGSLSLNPLILLREHALLRMGRQAMDPAV
jgi:hypothetical protein